MGPEVIVPVTFFATAFAMTFGIVYLRTRQNLAMIEKGMNPKDNPNQNRPAPYKNLKWALLLIGSGLGLFTAYILDFYVLHSYSGSGFRGHDGSEAIYFSLIAIGGGLGLFGSYKMEKEWWEKTGGDKL